MTNAKAVLQEIEDGVKKQGAELVKQVKGVIQLNVGAHKVHIDLKNGTGAVKWAEDKADVTITMSEETWIAMADGKLDGMQAFMGGKLKLKGNMMLAQKLRTVIEGARGK